VSGVDIGADGAGSRRHHHHTYHPAPDATICNSNGFGTVVVLFLCLSPSTKAGSGYSGWSAEET